MRRLTRRELFGWTAGALAAGCGDAGQSSPAAAIPPIGRTRPSHLKLSIAAYSYRDYLTGKIPKLDLFEFVNLAADMGLDGVEPTSYYFPPDVTLDYLNRLKLHAFSLGLDISGTAVGNNFCLPPGQAGRADRSRRALDRPRGRARRPGHPDLRRQRLQGHDRGTGGRPGPSRASTPSCRTPPRKASCSRSRITAGSPARPSRSSNWSRPSTHPTSA